MSPASGGQSVASSARLDSLTGARFLAALGVFLYHAALAFPADGVFGSALALVGRNGAVGVDFFFVLSGFVLAWSWQPGGSVRGFYRRRFARIAPAYWVALLYGLVWVIVLYGEPLRAASNTVPAVFGLQAWFPDPAVHYAANNPAWSVSAEVFFYALFPLLIAAAATRSGRRALLAGACVLGFAVPYILGATTTGPLGSWMLNTLPAVRIGEFICGLVLAVALRRGRRIPMRPATSFLAFLLCYFAVPALPAAVPGKAITLGAILLVIGALAQADSQGAGTALSRRWPVRLGELSYCFYLVHMMTTQIALFICARAVSGALLGPVWIGAALISSLVLATLLHRLVERPCERRLRRGRDVRVARPASARAPRTVRVPSSSGEGTPVLTPPRSEEPDRRGQGKDAARRTRVVSVEGSPSRRPTV